MEMNKKELKNLDKVLNRSRLTDKGLYFFKHLLNVVGYVDDPIEMYDDSLAEMAANSNKSVYEMAWLQLHVMILSASYSGQLAILKEYVDEFLAEHPDNKYILEISEAFKEE